jgi:hypothetical protein
VVKFVGNLICSNLKLYTDDKLTDTSKKMMKDILNVLKKTNDTIFADVKLTEIESAEPSTAFITYSNHGEIRYIEIINESYYRNTDSLAETILQQINIKTKGKGIL